MTTPDMIDPEVWEHRREVLLSPTPIVGTLDLTADDILALLAEPAQLLGSASERVRFRGGITCTCVAESLPFVEQVMLDEGLIKSNLDVYQLGYRVGGTAASGGTHDRGGCTDCGQYSDRQIECWRDLGWTMQKRYVPPFDAYHAHGWPNGCPHLSAAGRGQATQWANHTNGLVSRARIQGKWPIPKWDAAMKQKEQDMALSDSDIEKVANLVVEKVFAADAIPNVTAEGVPIFTSNAKNPTVTIPTALDRTGRKLNALQAAVDALQAAATPDAPAAP